jgi:hypothetical protein
VTLQDKIDALVEKAAALRALPEDEAEAAGLPLLVDAINNLRELQALGREALDEAIEQAHEAEFAATAESVNPKRGPGRPKKVQA